MPQIRYVLAGQVEPVWTGEGEIVPQKDDMIRHVGPRRSTAFEVAELGIDPSAFVRVHGIYRVIARTLRVRSYSNSRQLQNQGWDVTLELVEQYDEFPTQK